MSFFNFDHENEIINLRRNYEKEIFALKNELRKEKLKNYKNDINNPTNKFKNTITYGLIIKENNTENIYPYYDLCTLFNNIAFEIKYLLSLTPKLLKKNTKRVYFYWMHDIEPKLVTIDMVNTFCNFTSIICCNDICCNFGKQLLELGFNLDHFVFDIIGKYEKLGEINNLNNKELDDLYFNIFQKHPAFYNLNSTIKSEIVTSSKYKLKNELENQIFNQYNK
jgi:hypothetical protein